MKLPEFKIEKAVAKSDWDLPLSGLCYEPEKNRVFATDGHLCVIAKVEVDPKEVRGPIPIEAVKGARSGKKDKRPSLRAYKAVQVRSADGESFQTIRRNKAKIPNIDRLIEKVAFSKPLFSLDGALLVKMVEAMRVGSESLPLHFYVQASANPPESGMVLVATHESHGPIALLMPMRYSPPDAENALLRVGLPIPEKEAAPCS